MKKHKLFCRNMYSASVLKFSIKYIEIDQKQMTSYIYTVQPDVEVWTECPRALENRLRLLKVIDFVTSWGHHGVSAQLLLGKCTVPSAFWSFFSFTKSKRGQSCTFCEIIIFLLKSSVKWRLCSNAAQNQTTSLAQSCHIIGDVAL